MALRTGISSLFKEGRVLGLFIPLIQTNGRETSEGKKLFNWVVCSFEKPCNPCLYYIKNTQFSLAPHLHDFPLTRQYRKCCLEEGEGEEVAEEEKEEGGGGRRKSARNCA